MPASIQSSLKDFHLMVSGQIITILGSTLLRFALSLYVLDITGRADIFAGLYAVTSIPFQPPNVMVSNKRCYCIN